MSTTFILILAAAIPEVPASSVQLVQEGAVYVMRNLIDDTPLYTFNLDEPGKSNCDDTCARDWRPLLVAGNEGPLGDWTQVERADGSMQWAYQGMPVYSFARDPEPVTTSDGKAGMWKRLPAFPSQ